MRTIRVNGYNVPVINPEMHTEKKRGLPESTYLTLPFPDIVVRWMRPTSAIPGGRGFTLTDVVSIDSKLHIHLRDGRDIGAGTLEMLPERVRLRHELLLARMEKAKQPTDARDTANRLMSAIPGLTEADFHAGIMHTQGVPWSEMERKARCSRRTLMKRIDRYYAWTQLPRVDREIGIGKKYRLDENRDGTSKPCRPR